VLAGFLFGLLFILTLLVASWALRTVPAGVSTSVTAEEGASTPRQPPPAPPDPSPLLKASLADLQADATRLSAQRAALGEELRRQADRCKVAAAPPPPAPPAPAPPPLPKPRPPQQAAASPPAPPAPTPAPTPTAAAPPQPLPVDRWANKDLGVLQGCWTLGRDAPTVMGGSRRENCTANAGRICFDANGHGVREQTVSCPSGGTMSCRAPVTGQFAANGTFTTTQPDVTCTGASTARWVGRTLSCQRVDDAHAACLDSGRPDLGFPAQNQEFRRASP
jgi:hypothetical protein